MLLYHDPRAPNPRRVRMFLAEKGLTYDTIEVSIAEHANEAPSFRKKNPIALLPVLELPDGKVLRESIAICRYIEELHPAPNLFGTDAWERAQIEQWQRHAELEVLWPIQQIFRNTHTFFAGRIRQVPEFADVMREHVAMRLDWIEREIAARSHLAGDRFTIADITLAVALDFGRVVNVRVDPEVHPKLAAWKERIAARPSTKA